MMYSKNDFSLMIESLATQNEEVSYINTIVDYCNKNNLEIENVIKLLNKSLLAKIECEAETLNLVSKKKKKKHASLPI
jgi:hypothetical protein